MTPSMTADEMAAAVRLAEQLVDEGGRYNLRGTNLQSVGRALLAATTSLARVMPVVDAARAARRLSVELLSINTNESERYFAAHDAWIKATDLTDTMIARLDKIEPVEATAITAMRGEEP